jgi:glutathione S-transferase
MRLYYSPASPYARKCRVIIRELDMRVEETAIDPWTDPEMRRLNPLAKVPALLLDDGSAIYDSPVICEYLDEMRGGKFFPRPTLFSEAKGKWRALTLQALGDGLADAAVRRFVERRKAEALRDEKVIARQDEAIVAALAVLERASVRFPEEPTIGEVASACALGYLDLRSPGQEWRGTHPRLAAWYEDFARRPSMMATAPQG